MSSLRPIWKNLDLCSVLGTMRCPALALGEVTIGLSVPFDLMVRQKKPAGLTGSNVWPEVRHLWREGAPLDPWNRGKSGLQNSHYIAFAGSVHQ